MTKLDYQSAARKTRLSRADRDAGGELQAQRIEARNQVVLKRWLNVSYSDREAAKKAGCRWDPQARCWWCKLATPEYLIERWIRSQDLPQSEHKARPTI